jgi:kynurenine formamidase
VSRLGQVLDENASIFPGDPETSIEIVATVENDGYLVEAISMASHTGTHLDAPGHFIEGGRTVDQLTAEELVWSAYVIDVRARMAEEGNDFQLSSDDIHAYQREHGVIPPGSIVILYTGFGELFGTPAYEDTIPGFAGEAVEHLFVEHGIKALGTDTFGPDATSDENFDATYTALVNDGVVIPGMRNLGSLNVTGDIVMASPVQLRAGSAFKVDPLACHGR